MTRNQGGMEEERGGGDAVRQSEERPRKTELGRWDPRRGQGVGQTDARDERFRRRDSWTKARGWEAPGGLEEKQGARRAGSGRAGGLRAQGPTRRGVPGLRAQGAVISLRL